MLVPLIEIVECSWPMLTFESLGTKASDFDDAQTTFVALFCANKTNMRYSLQRIPPDFMVYAVYVAIVAFAFACYKGLI